MEELEDQLTRHTLSVDIPIDVQDPPNEQSNGVDHFDPTARMVASGELSDGTPIEAKVTGVRENSYNIRVSLGEETETQDIFIPIDELLLELIDTTSEEGVLEILSEEIEY